jgi:FkbM family methyltransferase
MNDAKLRNFGNPPAARLEPRFISYSANFEDVILHRLFAGKETGFYIDVGAAHPVYENDTMALYSAGWSGINIEPNPQFSALLDGARRRDRNIRVVMGERPGMATYYEVVDTGLSTCDASYAESARLQGYSIVEREILIRTLADILAEAPAPAIDLLKIDVEGWEEQVLKGNDWERYRPSVVMLEATIPERPERRPSGARDYLEQRGYRFAYFDGLNDFYVEKDFAIPEGAFALPPNIFDRFKLHRVAELEQSLKSARLDIADLEAHRYQLSTAANAMRRELVTAASEVRKAHEERAWRLYYQQQVEDRLGRLQWYALSPLRLAIRLARRLARRVRKALATP